MAKKNHRVPAAPSADLERASETGTDRPLVAEAVRPDLTPNGFSWWHIAKGEIGVKEIAGERHNPRIIEYHATTSLRGSRDEIPWCSSFVSWCMKAAGYPTTRSAAARSWLEYGQRIKDPVMGCIVVLTRNGGGHVGFYAGMENDRIRILGGNQSDSVNIAAYDRSRVLAYVLPRNLSPLDNAFFYDQTARIA